MPDLMLHLRGNKRLAVGSKSPMPVGAGSSNMMDASGTIAAANTAQEALAARDYRQYLLIIAMDTNVGTVWVNFGMDAAAGAGSIPLAPGDSLVYEGTYVPYESISVLGGTVGDAFTIKEG